MVRSVCGILSLFVNRRCIVVNGVMSMLVLSGLLRVGIGLRPGLGSMVLFVLCRVTGVAISLLIMTC